MQQEIKKNALIKLNPRTEGLLWSLGAPKYLTSQKPMRLMLSSFTSVSLRTRPKHVDAQAQYKYLETLLSDLNKPHCFCIASDPTDMSAKYLAAYIMQQAYETLKPRQPRWMDIYAEMRYDKEQVHTPSFFVFANVVASSTPAKFEKLRDRLERYSELPRIVVTSGCDPIQLFVEKLHYPLTGCAYIKSSAMKTIEIV